MKSHLFLPLAVAACAVATAEGAVDFDAEVLPILEDHCIDCHGDEKQKSALRLDTALGLLRGGESGEPLLVGGKSAESYLFKRVSTEVAKDAMPPKGKRLSAEQVAVLQRWIDEGAVIPGAEEARKELRVTTDHWSFQPVKRPEGGGIDGFGKAKLLENGLEASPEADRTTLIRRLFAVAHGMPPTPEQVVAFTGDLRPDAYDRLVDEVLASPRFGERWARQWMDVARYADSNGFETNRRRKTAYHYRDWLVESFNADKPYDRFVKEQLAGDRLGADAATGFLVAGPHDIVKSPDINLTLMQRQDELADMVNTTGTAFLGLTMGCARCHNHKFDPILQKDYYSMQAVFEGVSHGERPLREKAAKGREGELAAARPSWSDRVHLREMSANQAKPAAFCRVHGGRSIRSLRRVRRFGFRDCGFCFSRWANCILAQESGLFAFGLARKSILPMPRPHPTQAHPKAHAHINAGDTTRPRAVRRSARVPNGAQRIR